MPRMDGFVQNIRKEILASIEEGIGHSHRRASSAFLSSSREPASSGKRRLERRRVSVLPLKLGLHQFGRGTKGRAVYAASDENPPVLQHRSCMILPCRRHGAE